MANEASFSLDFDEVQVISSGTVNTVAAIQCRRGKVEIVVAATEPAATVQGLLFNEGDTVMNRTLTELNSGAAGSENIYAIGRSRRGSIVRIDHS